MTPSEVWLLEVARDAARWFDNKTRGTGRNGMHDDIVIGRELLNAIAAVDDEQREASAAPMRAKSA